MLQKDTLEIIEKSKHILLQTDNDSFANASALYTYLLTLHKKVSIYSVDEVEQKFAFLPWYDKLKSLAPSSADGVLEINAETLEYYTFFKDHKIKINLKMATALYSALLVRYDNFTSLESDGMVFATAKELIELGAEFKTAQKYIVKSDPLSLFRIKAILYQNMLLVKNATELELFVSDADLKSSGASMREVHKVLKEASSLVHIEKIVLKKSDENMKILEEIEIVK